MASESVALRLQVLTELNKAKADLKDLHSTLKNIEGAANSMGNALKTGLAILGIDKLVTGIAGAIGSTMAWDDAALKLTDTMNENATAATTWLAIGKAVGLESSAVQIAMKTLSVAVNENSATLRGMNVATVDAHGKFLSLGQVVNSVADYFERHQGATNNASLAVSLFGRQGASLLPILELGSDGIQRLSDHFRALGYVVNNDALQGFAIADAQFRDGQMAVAGLGMAITHALMPGLAALAGGLTDIIEAKMPEFIAAIQSAVSFVIGFFEGLTGGKAAMSDTAITLGKVGQAVGGYGDASDKATGSGNKFADAEQRVRDQAKAATEAIERQIKALEEQTQAENFQDQQRKLHLKLVDDNKKVDKAYSDYQNQILHGYEAAAMDSLTTLQDAQQTAADDATAIDKDAKQEQRRTLIDTLREQEKQINDAADKQIQAMQRAAQGSAAAIRGVAGQIPGIMGGAGAEAGSKMGLALNTAAEKAGKDLATKLKSGDWSGVGNAIGHGIASAIGEALSRVSWVDVFKLVIFRGHVPNSAGEWLKFFAGSMPGVPIPSDLMRKLTGQDPIISPTNPTTAPGGYGYTGYHAAGLDYVPWDNYRAVLHKGEAVVPAKDNKPGRGMVVNISINGATDPNRTARAVADQLGALLAA